MRQLCVTVQWMLLRLGHGAALHLGSGACETADASPAVRVRGPSHPCAHGRKRRERRRVGRGASAKSSQSPSGSTSARWAQ